MSKYTTEIRFICESEAGYDESKGYNDIATIISIARPKIFNFAYPIFDTNYKPVLETKILKHFYTREICEETYGLWKLRLEDKMNLIMPYYNKLYNSELIEFNPLYDSDYTINHSGEDEGTVEELNGNTRTLNTQDSDSGGRADKNVRWDLYSDTPQGGINGITADEDSVANNTYLTNARKITDDGTGSSYSSTLNRTGTIGDSGSVNRSSQNIDTYIDRVSGKRGTISYSKMIQEFRETFLNIDAMIIKDLKPLFFGLWN